MSRERLIDLVEEVLTGSEYQLVDIAVRTGNVTVIEVVLDKENGISIDDCAGINRKIVLKVDEEGIFNGKFTIDVCSPGLDRELKTDRDFMWAKGKQVKVITLEPVGDKREFIGILSDIDDPRGIGIELLDGDRVDILKGNISKTKLWFEPKK
jgi:ribosome maturation factor RimP